MADIKHNLPEVVAAIKAIAASWDFRARGMRKTFGEDALDVVAEGVFERTFFDQQRPDGSPLASLAPSTLRRKRRLGYPETILVETKAMGDLDEIKGRRAIERRTASMTYGLGSDTFEAKKAEWNAEGNAEQNRPPRPFYELDDAIEGRLDDLFEEILDRNIRELGG